MRTAFDQLSEKILRNFSPKISNDDVALFYRQIAILLAAGGTFIEALRIFNNGYKSTVTFAVSNILKKIDNGVPLRECLLRYPELFNKMIIEILISERHDIDKAKIFRHMADHFERRSDVWAAVRRATFYPKVLLIVVIIFSMINMVFIIPVFMDMFNSLGSELPSITLLYVSIHYFVKDNIFQIFIVGALTYCLINFTFAGRKILLFFSRFAPLLSGLLKEISTLRFARYTRILISSGIPLVDAMKCSAKSAENTALSKKIKKMANDTSGTEDFLCAMERSKIFPTFCLQIMYVGNRKNREEEAWNLLTEYYEKHVDSSLFKLMVLLRVSSVVIIGLLVGFVVISLYLPVFYLGSPL